MREGDDSGQMAAAPLVSAPSRPGVAITPPRLVGLLSPLVLWLPLAGLLAYAAVLAERLPSFLLQSVPQSDTVSPLLLTEALLSAGHGTIHLGAHAGFSNMLIVGLALPFPDHRIVAQALPYAVYVLGALLLSGSVVRLAGWRSGVLSFAVCVAATSALLFNQASPAGRITTLANLPLLGIFLSRLVDPASLAARRGPLVAATIALGTLTGFDIASDPYLLIVGILPLGITATAAWLRWRDEATVRLGKLTAGLIAVAAVAALLTFGAAQLLQLHYGRPAVQLASAHSLEHNLRLLGAAMWSAIGTPISYRQLGAGSDAIGLFVCAAVVAALGGSAAALTRAHGAHGAHRARTAHILFWSLVAGATTVAFVATNYPVDVLSIRYLTPLWLALAALIPFLGTRRRWAQFAVAAAVSALTAANAWSLASLTPPPTPASSPLVQTLEANHLTFGYADYWESNIVTWATDGTVAIRPVIECAGAARLCPDRLNSADGWYRPTGGPTAVIVDRSIIRAPTAYGPWQRVISVGAVKIYVFQHGIDLAAGS